MDAQALIGARVELSAPDGRVFHFQVVSLVPYAGETYAVLEHEGEDGQLLVTHVETDADQAPVFVVVGEDDIITSVLEKQVAQTIARAMENMDDTDDDEDACDCGCHHDHGEHDHCHCSHDHGDHDHCNCGHDHKDHDHCRCGHDHGHDSRACGHHHPLPSYIKRQS